MQEDARTRACARQDLYRTSSGADMPIPKLILKNIPPPSPPPFCKIARRRQRSEGYTNFTFGEFFFLFFGGRGSSLLGYVCLIRPTRLQKKLPD